MNKEKKTNLLKHYDLIFKYVHPRKEIFFDYVKDAIAREKQIKDWNKNRKDALVTAFNPGWKFLNEELFGKWPPDNLFRRKDSYLE